jgi:uncharacterized protein HemX
MAPLIAAIVLLAAVVVGGGLFVDKWRQERSRDQARLRFIEGQMATLKAALRIQVAEHVARRQMQETVLQPEFSGRHDAGDPWVS